MADIKKHLMKVGSEFPELLPHITPILDHLGKVAASRLTLSQVNREIRRRGIDAELHKGDGYYYFTGADVGHAFETSVMVYRLNDLSLEQWMKELEYLMQPR
jgi:hypothetical protein